MHAVTHRRDTTNRNPTVNWRASIQDANQAENLSNETQSSHKLSATWTNPDKTPVNSAWGRENDRTERQSSNSKRRRRLQIKLVLPLFIWPDRNNTTHRIRYRCLTSMEPRLWARTGDWISFTESRTSVMIPYQSVIMWIKWRCESK